MTQKNIPLAEASEAQLRAFAETHLGIDVHPNAKIETVRAKVQQAWGKDEIPVQEDKPAMRQVGSAPRSNTPRADATEFIVFVEREDKFDGDEPVPLGCNGKLLILPRGEWCAVPIRFLDSLRNAVEHRREGLKEGGLGPVRKVNRYPYRIWNGEGEPAEGVRRPAIATQTSRTA
jgi:hypothetical protein